MCAAIQLLGRSFSSFNSPCAGLCLCFIWFVVYWICVFVSFYVAVPFWSFLRSSFKSSVFSSLSCFFVVVVLRSYPFSWIHAENAQSNNRRERGRGRGTHTQTHTHIERKRHRNSVNSETLSLPSTDTFGATFCIIKRIL